MAEDSSAGQAQKRAKLSNNVLERLSVGGVHVDTSKDTLNQLPYFRKMYELEEERGLKPVLDSEGRVFVDRNGDLFQVIVDYLRTQLRPSQQFLQQRERELRAEAEFYGCEMLMNELDGVTDMCKLETREREVRQAESAVLEGYILGTGAVAGILVDVFTTLPDFIIKPPEDLHYPLLFEGCNTSQRFNVGCKSVLPSSLQEFEARLQTMVGGWLPMLKDVPVVIGGGAVLAALVEEGDLRNPGCAVDVFFCGVTPERADVFVEALLNSLAEQPNELGFVQAHVVRSKAAITVTVDGLDASDTGMVNSYMPPLHIMLTVYRDPLEVLVNCDVDCCAVLYDPASQKVLCTPRCQRALNHRANVIDTALRGAHYEGRLEKYARRGFCVAVPGLELSQVDQRLFKEQYLLVQPQGLLLRMGELQVGASCEIQRTAVNWSPMMDPDEADAAREFLVDNKFGEVKTTSVRSAVAVPHSLERLLVLERIRVRSVDATHVKLSSDGDREVAEFSFPVSAYGPPGTVDWTHFKMTMPKHQFFTPTRESTQFIRQLEVERAMTEEPAHLYALPTHLTPAEDRERGSLLDPASEDVPVEVALRRLAARKQVGFVWELWDLDRTAWDLGRVRTVLSATPQDSAWPPQLKALVRDLSAEELAAALGLDLELRFAGIDPEEYVRYGRCAAHHRQGTGRGCRPFLRNVYSFSN